MQNESMTVSRQTSEPEKPMASAGGRWVKTPTGERIFLLDQMPESAPRFISGDAAAASPKVRIIPGTALPAGMNFIPGSAPEAAPASGQASGQASEQASGQAAVASPSEAASPSPSAASEPPVMPAPVMIRPVAVPSPGDGVATVSATARTDEAVGTAESDAAESDTAESDEPWTEASDRLKIEARSEELQEIISFVPGWLVRWGITVVFLTVIGLLALAWVVRYPEVVHGTLKVTTPSPPVRLVARGGGELERLFVRDGDAVTAAAHLGVFRSAADYRDVLRLESELAALRVLLEDSREPLDWEIPESTFTLGDLEVPYSNLLQALAEYRSFRNDSFYSEVVESLRQQIGDQQRLRESQEKKQRLLAEELGLVERQRARKEELAQSGLLSAQEKDVADSDYLRMLQTAQNARGEVVTTDSRITQIQSSLLEARQRQDEQQRTLRLSVRSNYHALRAAIDRWRQDYLVMAPSAGRVSFFRDLAEGQFLAPYEAILAVVPEEEDAVATSLLEPLGAGRVKPGQRAILRFDTFPPEEYGTVEGRVESISQLMDQPRDDQENQGYLVRITLPEGLHTTYGKRLEFRQEMGGTADIVTEDLSVLERLFHQLRSVIHNARA